MLPRSPEWHRRLRTRRSKARSLLHRHSAAPELRPRVYNRVLKACSVLEKHHSGPCAKLAVFEAGHQDRQDLEMTWRPQRWKSREAWKEAWTQEEAPHKKEKPKSKQKGQQQEGQPARSTSDLLVVVAPLLHPPAHRHPWSREPVSQRGPTGYDGQCQGSRSCTGSLQRACYSRSQRSAAHQAARVEQGEE